MTVLDVSGDESKVQCCKEEYCIGTLNVRSINQGKLDVIKQEMARVNTDILGISELKWMGMGEFNSDDRYIYCCGQGSLRRKRVALKVNKRVQNASKCKFCIYLQNPMHRTWVQSPKQQNDLGLFPRQTIQYHSTPNLCPNHWCQRSWSWPVLWRPTRSSRTNTHTQKDVLFIIGHWNAKARSQETLGVTGKFGLGVQNEAEQKLIEFCQQNTLVIANTLFQQHKRWLYTWASPNGQYRNQIDHVFAAEDGEALSCFVVIKNNTGSWLWFRSSAPYCKIQV